MRAFNARILPVGIGIALAMAAFGGAGTTEAAPAAQSTLTILAVGFVDVAGGSDPDCPACNGEYDDADEAFASSNPLAPMEFVVRSGGGAEVARATTSALVGFQRVTFEVPDLMDDESYTLELVAPPGGWLLCFDDNPTRTLTPADFSLGSTREDFRFYQGCDSIEPTVVPPTETPIPGAPTVTPGGPTAVPQPTRVPSGNGGGDGSKDDDPVDPRFETDQLGSITGVAFVDLNANGTFEAGEPGLNDVGIKLHGGGLELLHLTNATGVYNFEALGAGVYDVFIEPGSEWYITTPSKYVVPVAGGINRGYDFGLIRYSDLPGAHAPATGVGGRAPVSGAIRLPSTGIADLPIAPSLGLLALVLGGLAGLGFAFERRRGI